ncbi:MAG: diacylglycerol kinase [Pseudomonadales bacterium]|nr:diacylglycerol kinase [Pseudomonadales bacterium]MBL6816334.1 diacylglycerol kinase [Pseudomonadales bacterium]
MKPPVPKTGLRRVLAATRYSFNGLLLALKTEEAFKQEFALFIVLAPLGFWLGQNDIERLLLVGVLVLVLIVELLNTAIEAVVDRVSSDFHELSRQAKDLGSAAVFLSLALVVITWSVIIL